MTPTEKALLLQAAVEAMKANNGEYLSIKNNSKEVINLILESVIEDIKKVKDK
jgi:hypothetical protein